MDHYSLTEDIFRIGSAVCQLSKDVEVPIKATSLKKLKIQGYSRYKCNIYFNANDYLHRYDTIDYYSLKENIFCIESAVYQSSKDVEVPIKATSLKKTYN